MPDCPAIRRVSQGFAECDQDDGHEGPHKDGEVYWNNMKLRFIVPLNERSTMGTPFGSAEQPAKVVVNDVAGNNPLS